MKLLAEEKARFLSDMDDCWHFEKKKGHDSSPYECLIESRLRLPIFDHEKWDFHFKVNNRTFSHRYKDSVEESRLVISPGNQPRVERRIWSLLSLASPKVPRNTHVLDAAAATAGTKAAHSLVEQSNQPDALMSTSNPWVNSSVIVGTSASPFENIKPAIDHTANNSSSIPNAAAFARRMIEATDKATSTAASSLTTNLAAGALAVSGAALAVSGYNAYNSNRSSNATVKSTALAEETLKITKSRWKFDRKVAQKKQERRRAKNGNAANVSTSTSSNSSSNPSESDGDAQEGNVAEIKRRTQHTTRAERLDKAKTELGTRRRQLDLESKALSIRSQLDIDQAPHAMESMKLSAPRRNSNEDLSMTNVRLPFVDVERIHFSTTSDESKPDQQNTKGLAFLGGPRISEVPKRSSGDIVDLPCCPSVFETSKSRQSSIALSDVERTKMNTGVKELESLHRENEMQNQRLAKRKAKSYSKIQGTESSRFAIQQGQYDLNAPISSNHSLHKAFANIGFDQRLEAACHEVRHRHNKGGNSRAVRPNQQTLHSKQSNTIATKHVRSESGRTISAAAKSDVGAQEVLPKSNKDKDTNSSEVVDGDEGDRTDMTPEGQESLPDAKRPKSEDNPSGEIGNRTSREPPSVEIIKNAKDTKLPVEANRNDESEDFEMKVFPNRNLRK